MTFDATYQATGRAGAGSSPSYLSLSLCVCEGCQSCDRFDYGQQKKNCSRRRRRRRRRRCRWHCPDADAGDACCPCCCSSPPAAPPTRSKLFLIYNDKLKATFWTTKFFVDQNSIAGNNSLYVPMTLPDLGQKWSAGITMKLATRRRRRRDYLEITLS